MNAEHDDMAMTLRRIGKVSLRSKLQGVCKVNAIK
eukprot:CAMPEP_0197662198 /NCGR_PEP_ID=MMETSP1338-20131121/52450_1 /TAXON_ID=43686 ORGANISM="Pelagodinium beii, Strain RCC1491" /NCGR_SAMPLE_ID=MMETSP1338 /ASSEMBLY_ACC=CAM_ASM_000754 /LENGTH=34 /DNA_ID= /DNA_START= /DNA_END= /DNA_ORIENTATION=